MYLNLILIPRIRIYAFRWSPLGRLIDRKGKKEKTRILHQHIGLGEELPGLHYKSMNKIVFDKTFFR